MACGYYCFRFDCYRGLEATPENLLGSSFRRIPFTATPEDESILYDAARKGIVVRTVVGGPYQTIMLAEKGCPDEESDSDSSSFSESGSESVSESQSLSESESEPPPYECEPGVNNACCYRIVDLNNLNYCCSTEIDFAGFGPDNNIIQRVDAGIWTGEYDDGAGRYYSITMSSVAGPIQIGETIYGDEGQNVFVLTIICEAEILSELWTGVIVEDPTLPEWEALGGCNVNYGSILLQECESSDSESSSFSFSE